MASALSFLKSGVNSFVLPSGTMRLMMILIAMKNSFHEKN
jgi:hypothetical protein